MLENKTVQINYATLGLLALILLPTLYLGIKGRLARPVKQAETVVVQPTMALAERVHLANVNPTFQNLFDLGFAYQENKMPEKAVEVYRKAIALNPNNARAYNNMGAAYGDMGMWVDQIAASKKALELDPQLELARNNLRWAQNNMNAK